MKIEPARTSEIRYVAERMRDRDVAEFSALNRADTREELAAAMVAQYGGSGDVLCATHDDEPVCIGGFFEFWPSVVTLMLFATDDFPQIVVPLTRFMLRVALPSYEGAGIHRVQAIALARNAETCRWLELLGLKREAVMRGYGKQGEDFIQFAKVSDVRPAAH